jgi:hypothetical protein
MGSPFGNIEVRGARENNLMSYPSAAITLCWRTKCIPHGKLKMDPQQQAYRGRAPTTGGSTSLHTWSRSWRE